jgi:CheY-like chemotaxis protein
MTSNPSSTIVIVDDDQDHVFLFKRLLDKCGFKERIVVFLGADEAIAFFARAAGAGGGVESPTITFVDVKMPGRTGIDVLRAIRSHKALDSMPVLMLSSSDDPGDLTRAARCGAQCFLTKYPSETELREAVEHARIYCTGQASEDRGLFHFRANLLISP